MAGFGALFDQVNNEGNTPLHNAAASGAGMCVKFLGQRGKLFKNLIQDPFLLRGYLFLL